VTLPPTETDTEAELLNLTQGEGMHHSIMRAQAKSSILNSSMVGVGRHTRLSGCVLVLGQVRVFLRSLANLNDCDGDMKT
jgi:hypothetical protein